jgi:AcrR family transcriptional regulator
VATNGARTTTTARGDAAREAILDAAFVRFSGYGLRRTSMEDIAREARVSRASIYFHFGSKDQVFRALAERLHEQNLTAMRAAAAATGPVESRIRGALEARLGSFVEITYSSPHGDELLDEHNRVCGDIAAASQGVALKILRGLVREATATGELDPASVGLSPATAAAILLDCAEAAKTEPGVAPRAFRRRLAQIVRTLVAGMRPASAAVAAP